MDSKCIVHKCVKCIAILYFMSFSNNCLELNENVAKLSIISRPVRFLHIMYRYFQVHDFMHCQKCNDTDFAPFGNVRYISVTRTSCFTMGAYGSSNSD